MTFAYTTVCSQPARSAPSTMPNEGVCLNKGFRAEFLLRSASLPPQHAQHRRALGTPTLRVGLRRKEGLFAFATQHLRASVCAKPAHTGSTCWAIIFHPSGVGLSQSELCFRILK